VPTSPWQQRGAVSTALLPLAALFEALARRRRHRLEASRGPSPLPVLVIGNLAVGGTGKTPLVAAVIALCTARGVRCGIVSRGYGGRAQRAPRSVRTDDDPAETGDEPLMLHRLTGVPVVVCTARAQAVAALAARGDIDLVIADDGLQHYAMARAAEVCVIDARTGLGNGRTLPAGPLRERACRLDEVDVIALRDGDDPDTRPPGVSGWPAGPSRGTFTLVPDRLVTLDGDERDLHALSGLRAHAVAGIGRPQRLFDALRGLGMEVVPHAFADHHRYRTRDLLFDEALPIVTTSKDAVKIARLVPSPVEVLELRMRTVLSAALDTALVALLERLTTETRTCR